MSCCRRHIKVISIWQIFNILKYDREAVWLRPVRKPSLFGGFNWDRVGINCGSAKRWPQHFKLDLRASLEHANVISMRRTLPFSGGALETADWMWKITLCLSDVINAEIKTRRDTRHRTIALKSRVNDTMHRMQCALFLSGLIVILVPFDSPWEGKLSAWPLLAAVVTPQLSDGAVVSAHLLSEHFCVVNGVRGVLTVSEGHIHNEG